VVMGISVDHVPGLKAWADSMGGIDFPLLSDFYPHGEISQRYGVLRAEGFSERAIFVIDSDGIIRYIDVHAIDDQPDNAVLFAELEKLAPIGWVAKRPVETPLPHGGVVMYCTRWCPDCIRARAWLKSNGIAYTEVDIDAHAAAARQVREWCGGNQTTPTFEIDGTIVIDFDEPRLAELLLQK